MLAKVSRIFFGAAMILSTAIFIWSCNSCNTKRTENISSTELNLKIDRFDLAMTAHPEQPVETRFATFHKQYGNFFNHFVDDIIHINAGDNAQLINDFNRFLSDPDFNEVSTAVKDTFKDITAMEKTISSALGRYKSSFPEKKVPQVIAFVSLFNYAIICTDSVLGIGLDMYLGSKSKYYPALGFPVYKINKMSKEYIPADAVRGWIESEFEPEGGNHDFLSQVIYHGKILYLLQELMPEVDDTLKTGYTASQLQWCYGNEQNIWSFFVEKKLLFSTNMELYSKYTSEGPNTSGFPPQSPGNVGSFIGWQIIKAYMEENPKTSLAELMKQTDAATILKDSKYKPKK